MSHFPKIQLLILSSLCVFLFFSRLLSGFQFGSPHFLLGASIFKGRLDYFPHNVLQSSFLSFFLLFSLGFAFFHCYSLRSYQSPKNTLSMSQVKCFSIFIDCSFCFAEYSYTWILILFQRKDAFSWETSPCLSISAFQSTPSLIFVQEQSLSLSFQSFLQVSSLESSVSVFCPSSYHLFWLWNWV